MLSVFYVSESLQLLKAEPDCVGVHPIGWIHVPIVRDLASFDFPPLNHNGGHARGVQKKAPSVATLNSFTHRLAWSANGCEANHSVAIQRSINRKLRQHECV